LSYEVRTFDRGRLPSEDLLEVADDVDADLIVIGLRRRSTLGKFILGSNAGRSHSTDAGGPLGVGVGPPALPYLPQLLPQGVRIGDRARRGRVDRTRQPPLAALGREVGQHHLARSAVRERDRYAELGVGPAQLLAALHLADDRAPPVGKQLVDPHGLVDLVTEVTGDGKGNLAKRRRHAPTPPELGDQRAEAVPAVRRLPHNLVLHQ
jgi:hypothetical protein